MFVYYISGLLQFLFYEFIKIAKNIFFFIDPFFVCGNNSQLFSIQIMFKIKYLSFSSEPIYR